MMNDQEKLTEALRILQLALFQCDRVMQSWHLEEWENLKKLGLKFEWETEDK